MATVAAVMALGFTAACGGASSEDADKTDKAKQEGASKPPAAPAPESPAKGSANGGRTLSEQELDKAALSEGDAKGFAVTTLADAPPGGEKAGKAECRPLTAVISGTPEPAASATVYRQLTAKGKAGQTVITEFLTAHQQKDAAKVLEDLRAAVKACAAGFTAQGEDGPSKYSAVKELPAPKAGDDVLAYQVTGDYEGESVPLVFHLMRSGSTIATFYTANLVDAKTPEIPAALVMAQADKLK
ncbi:hypothetical protein ABZW18_24260 [Streptomyces sp. NPDC004647]|uniref:hypothetical protein n=1 Tax=Streptomyces sp. NPDC004647 TaxID=3154671 RepID=UPI00339E21DE